MRLLAFAPFLVLLAALPARAQERVLADGESLDGWTAVTPEGVELRLSLDAGREGRAIRLDYDFHGHGGYAIARRAVDLTLPENYRFRWSLRAAGPDGAPPPIQDLEFKIVDPSGQSVWWHNRRRFEYPSRWTRLTSRARHVSFAWGPAAGRPPAELGALEFVVTAVTGGRGTVWIDDVTYEPLPPEGPYTGTATASASRNGRQAARTVDGDAGTTWTATGGTPTLTLDFGQDREFGALALTWGDHAAADYDVELSDDGRSWMTARQVRDANGGLDRLYLPESEARYVRLRLLRSTGGGYALREVEAEPVAVAAVPNAWLLHVAERSPLGRYPRSLMGRGTFWTVIGADRDEAEAIVGEDGEVEVGKRRFTLEPFLYTDGRLLSWADADSVSHALAETTLPVPIVTRHYGPLRLETTAFVAGDSAEAMLYLRYRVAGAAGPVRLLVAARPWNVNPPYQWLNVAGGWTPVRDVQAADGRLVVDGRPVTPLSPAEAVGATSSLMGDVSDWLATGRVPPASAAYDSTGFGSGALAFSLPGDGEVWLALPMDGSTAVTPHGLTPEAAAMRGAEALAATTAWWNGRINHPEGESAVELVGPPDVERLQRTLRTQAAYILINRDGPAIQPGSRSYDRSWIRDGSLTSSAMLRLGYTDVARDFARWYAPTQYASGKVPCCVDERGADPTNEHDSHGQLVFLFAEVYRYTHDGAFLREMWPHVERAVAYVDSMRHTRMGAAYTANDSVRAYYGLMPESISHEGYSDRAVHSYWDQIFTLRGLKDAVSIAQWLGEADAERRFTAIRDSFAVDLAASYRRTMQQHGIAYVPGSVEKGDFDATSVTVALDPAEIPEVLPPGALAATFDRYRDFVAARADGSLEWDGYTPYELRAVGTFARLGRVQDAHDALDFFFRGQHPGPWYQWAEVVWSDPRKPGYVGDTPHTWVGSDFIRSALDLFAYHDGDRLVLGAGLTPEWLAAPGGVGIRYLRTPYGLLSYTAHRDGDAVTFRIEGGVQVPPGGLAVRSPSPDHCRATVDGRPVACNPEGEAVVRSVPARVVFPF